MKPQMAYLLGMIIGNGEIQRGPEKTTVVIEIPHKMLFDEEGRETPIYVKSSLADIRNIIEPLIGTNMPITTGKTSTKISFAKPNDDDVIKEINRIVNNKSRQQTMEMNDDIFSLSTDEKKEFLRGVADVTGYIRRSNIAFGRPGNHRVYIEIPGNWNTVIALANLLKSLDVPVQTIDFGHPNFRDPQLKDYNKGKTQVWKREHQLKIWANEFMPIGFNIVHKQKGLEKLVEELLQYKSPKSTHKYYWESRKQHDRTKPHHPMENDPSLPAKIRGKHYDSWRDLAKDLGYGKD